MMQLGVIGLGRMGGNITLRLGRTGHRCVVYDRNADIVREFAEAGTVTAAGLAELVARLDAPRAVWLMLPAGRVSDEAVRPLADLLSPHDIDRKSTRLHSSPYLAARIPSSSRQ